MEKKKGGGKRDVKLCHPPGSDPVGNHAYFAKEQTFKIFWGEIKLFFFFLLRKVEQHNERVGVEKGFYGESEGTHSFLRIADASKKKKKNLCDVCISLCKNRFVTNKNKRVKFWV